MVIEAIRDRIKKEKKLGELSWQSIVAYKMKHERINFFLDYEFKSGGGGITPVDETNFQEVVDGMKKHFEDGDKLEVSFMNRKVITHENNLVAVNPEVGQRFKLVP